MRLHYMSGWMRGTEFQSRFCSYCHYKIHKLTSYSTKNCRFRYRVATHLLLPLIRLWLRLLTRIKTLKLERKCFRQIPIRNSWKIRCLYLSMQIEFLNRWMYLGQNTRCLCRLVVLRNLQNSMRRISTPS